jgi:hypothetical protein
MDLTGTGEGPVANSCEHANEPSGTTNGREGFVHLSEYQLFKKDSAAWSRLEVRPDTFLLYDGVFDIQHLLSLQKVIHRCIKLRVPP